ncbi:hypothetical protein DFH08DRAFT_1076406, partial [Mycena albidolilacea]
MVPSPCPSPWPSPPGSAAASTPSLPPTMARVSLRFTPATTTTAWARRTLSSATLLSGYSRTILARPPSPPSPGRSTERVDRPRTRNIGFWGRYKSQAVCTSSAKPVRKKFQGMDVASIRSLQLIIL